MTMEQYFRAVLRKDHLINWRRYSTEEVKCYPQMKDQAFMDCRYTALIKGLLFQTPAHVLWAGSLADPEPDKERNMYEGARAKRLRPLQSIPYTRDVFSRMHYLVNHTKKQFLDYAAVLKDSSGNRLDPLPILTAEGNGRGQGDYYGLNRELAGTWARDIISIEETIPEGYDEYFSPFMWWMI